MTFENAKKLVNKAIESQDPVEILQIIDQINEGPEIFPNIIEAIFSSVNPEILDQINEIYESRQTESSAN